MNFNKFLNKLPNIYLVLTMLKAPSVVKPKNYKLPISKYSYNYLIIISNVFYEV